jgi:hypothetical protein
MINFTIHISEQLALKGFLFLHARQGMSIFDLGVHTNIENFSLNIMSSVLFKAN